MVKSSFLHPLFKTISLDYRIWGPTAKGWMAPE